MQHIGCFISPHGFGHATRAIAVLEALQILSPDLHIHIFTTVPESIFRQSLANITYHQVVTDIGLSQTSALDGDIPTTIAQLDAFLPFPEELIDDLSKRCDRCLFLLCDIAPLGISVARKMGIPSILVESFTWDWIYAAYTKNFPELTKHVEAFEKIFAQADYHIQTEPLCQVKQRDLACGPIFRTVRQQPAIIRQQLGCGDTKMILITMGGVVQQFPLWDNLSKFSECFFVFTGQRETRQQTKNILMLDQSSKIYHPDLIAAADLVVCKAGYSTIAECCQAGVRVISVGRDDFPETAPLQSFVQNALGGVTIDADNFLSGRWLSMIPDLLLQSRPIPVPENGASAVASFLKAFL
jgi:hypothetical protein